MIKTFPSQSWLGWVTWSAACVLNYQQPATYCRLMWHISAAGNIFCSCCLSIYIASCDCPRERFLILSNYFITQTHTYLISLYIWYHILYLISLSISLNITQPLQSSFCDVYANKRLVIVKYCQLWGFLLMTLIIGMISLLKWPCLAYFSMWFRAYSQISIVLSALIIDSVVAQTVQAL